MTETLQFYGEEHAAKADNFAGRESFRAVGWNFITRS